MDLKIKNGKGVINVPLLEEKLGGVELPYLHVKKGDKTWYTPFIKNSKEKAINKAFFVKLKYKDEKYNLLQRLNLDGYEPPLKIGVITSENGFIRKSVEIKENQGTILFNKAKRLSIYGRCSGDLEKIKLIDLNYNDILMVVVINEFAFFLNYNTEEQKYEAIDINSLEFREE